MQEKVHDNQGTRKSQRGFLAVIGQCINLSKLNGHQGRGGAASQGQGSHIRTGDET